MKADDLDELVARAIEGDSNAFSEITRKLMQQVTALTYRMTGDREAALDLAQEAFVSAWQNLKNFRKEAQFTSWLYRIAVNMTLNYLKSIGRNKGISNISTLVSEPQSLSNPEQDLMRKELVEDVLEFVSGLPPAQRVIFDLRFYKSMTFDEIATVTDRAVGTVKTGYREAVKKLRLYAVERGWR